MNNSSPAHFCEWAGSSVVVSFHRYPEDFRVGLHFQPCSLNFLLFRLSIVGCGMPPMAICLHDKAATHNRTPMDWGWIEPSWKGIRNLPKAFHMSVSLFAVYLDVPECFFIYNG